MHDVENEVYTRVSNAILAEFPNVNMSGTYVKVPSAFPHVCITQQDTYNVKRYWTQNEEYDDVMFEVSIYSNKSSGKKTECKAIAREVNKIMSSMNFRRLSQVPVPNLEDASIYRIVARYAAITDGKYFYRR
ncbi:MAG: hypothetical protein IJ740_18955 [Ruminococcus sp.]|nr:hypothetical protein [Ruminococcus sp.]MBR1752922.1 hypothetical protein [Ruminococcus sp.]